MKKLLIVVYSAFVLLGQSCIKSEDFDLSKSKGIELDGTYGIALFSDEFTALKMLKRFDSLNQIIVNDDGYISYIAGQNSSSILGSDFIQINDQNFSHAITANAAKSSAFAALPVGNSIEDSSTVNWILSVGSYELDSILFKSGFFTIDIANEHNVPLQATVEIPGLKLTNGTSFKENIVVNRLNAGSYSLNLQGTRLDLTQNGTQFNRLQVKLKVAFNKGSLSDALLTGRSVGFNLRIADPQFKIIYGYFGNDAISIPPSKVTIELFEASSNDGSVFFENPKLNLYLDNSYGLDVQLTALSPFRGIDLNDNPIPITGVSLPFIIDRANTIGEKRRTTKILQSPQVNIRQLAEAPVKEIEFGGQGVINPSGKQKNFALDTSRVTLTSEIELPFYGSFKNFGFDSKSAFTPPADADILAFAEIKLIIENGFGFGLKMQVFYLDSNDNVVDSLFQTVDAQNVIPTANVNPATGKVINKTVKTTIIRLDQATLIKMNERGVTQIRLRTEALSYNNGNTSFKVYPDDSMIIKAGLKVKVKGVVK